MSQLRCEYCNTLLNPQQELRGNTVNTDVTYTSRVAAQAKIDEKDKTNMGKYFGGCVGMFIICIVIAGLIKDTHKYDAILGIFGILWLAFFGFTCVSLIKWAFKKR